MRRLGSTEAPPLSLSPDQLTAFTLWIRGKPFTPSLHVSTLLSWLFLLCESVGKRLHHRKSLTCHSKMIYSFCVLINKKKMREVLTTTDINSALEKHSGFDPRDPPNWANLRITNLKSAALFFGYSYSKNKTSSETGMTRAFKCRR